MTILYRVVITGGFMFVAACAPQSPAPKEESARSSSNFQQQKVDEKSTTIFAPPRLPPDEVKRFLKRAKSGDVEAMSTLSVHHFAGSEPGLGYHWLREAAKLGDCDSILHLVENEFRGVTDEEMPHWRKEQERLGCDPERDERAKPVIRIGPSKAMER